LSVSGIQLCTMACSPPFAISLYSPPFSLSTGQYLEEVLPQASFSREDKKGSMMCGWGSISDHCYTFAIVHN
jgi:hypothetical protein